MLGLQAEATALSCFYSSLKKDLQCWIMQDNEHSILSSCQVQSSNVGTPAFMSMNVSQILEK